MTAANRLQLTRVREAAFGVTPDPAEMTKCFVTGETLKVRKDHERSETITGDRLISEHVPVGVQIEGQGRFEFAFGYIDWALEASAMGLFAAAVEAYNLTPDSVITDVVAATDIYSAAGNWAEGHLVRAVGFTAAANNGRRRAIAGSGAGTLKVGAGGALVDEAAPPAGARLFVVGFQGATGDLSITADGLASVALDFTTLGLKVDQQVRIGPSGPGAPAVNKFGDATVDTYLTIEDISANLIRFRDKPPGWPAGGLSGAGKDIQVFTGDFLETGDTLITDTFEKSYLGQAVPKYLQMTGCAVNLLNFTLQRKQIARGDVTIIGQKANAPSLTSLDATPTVPTVGRVMNTANNIARICEGDVDVAAAAACREMTWAFNNNIQPVEALGSEHAVGLQLGDAELRTTNKFLFGNWGIYEKFFNGVDSSIMFPIYRDGYAYVFRCCAMTYTEADVPTENRNGQVEITVAGEQKKHGVTGRGYTCTRFRETA